MEVPFDQTPLVGPQSTEVGYRQIESPDLAQGLTGQLNDIANNIRQHQLKIQGLDLTNAAMGEINQRQAIQEDAEQNVTPGAVDFTKNLEAQFQQRDQAFKQTYQNQGYDPAMIEQQLDRLDRFNNTAMNRAFNFQTREVYGNAKTTAQNLGVQVGQYVSRNPDQMEDGVKEVTDQVNNIPGLLPSDKSALINELVPQVRTQARTGFALLHPDVVMNTYDQNGMFKQHSTITPTGVAPGGLDQDSIINFVQNDLEGGSKVANVGDGTGITKYGISSSNNPSVDVPNLTAEQAAGIAKSKYWFSGLQGQTPQMQAIGFDAAYLSGPQYGQELITAANGDPAKAMALYRAHLDSIADNNPDKAQFKDGWNNRLNKLQSFVDQNSSAPTPTDGSAPSITNPGGSGLTLPGNTGNPVLDGADASEALRMISIAKPILDQQDTQFKAQVDLQHKNAVSEALQNGGNIAGPVPSLADLTHTYGPVTGNLMFTEQVNAVRNGQFLKTMGSVNSQDGWTALNNIAPKPGSPTYAEDAIQFAPLQKAWQAALQYRQADPQNYVLDNNPNIRTMLANAKTPQDQQAAYGAINAAYDKLGIAPNDRNAFPATSESQVIQDYNSKSATAKFGQISNWQQTMPPAMFQNALSLLAHNGAGTDVTMYNIMHNNPGYQGTAGQVMAGLDAIKADPSRAQFTPVMNSQFHNTIGPAALQGMAPIVSDAFSKAAEALYIQRGGTATKEGVGNQALYTEALRQAVGGQAGNKDTGWYSMNGPRADMLSQSSFISRFLGTPAPNPGLNSVNRIAGTQTILPAGVTGTQFQNWIDKGGLNNYWQMSDNHAPAIAATGHIANALDVANNGVLVMTEPGRYAVYSKLDGKQLITHQGTPYILNIDRKTVLGQ